MLREALETQRHRLEIDLRKPLALDLYIQPAVPLPAFDKELPYRQHVIAEHLLRQ